MDGNYIRVQSGPSKRYFLSLVQECDPLLKKLVDRIIAICPSYSLVVSFNENNDNCLVNQALNAFISANIKEYFVLLSQLEIMDHQKALTLQKMWYIINPFFPNFEILSSVCNRIRKGGCVGGAVLSILHEKTQNVVGNMKAYAFCLEMTKTACEPYFRILEHWLTRGTIHDPYGEFFIEENKQLKGEEIEDDIYWEHYFQIIPNRVPLFLKKFADKIFMTGKYISVIRKTMKECANLPKCERFEYTGEERIFYQTIENSYASVSKMLLNLMLKDLQLLEHIKTIKHYFLMDQADFIEEFMDAASDELCKDINDLMPARLESLLQLAVRTSVINDESHADNLGIEVISESILYQFSKVLSYGDDEVDDQLDELNDDMNGYQAVALKYKVKWPLTLILNHNTLKYYQMLFRYQFYCKSIEKQLKSIWLNWKNTKSRCMKDSNNRAALLIGFLRQKMMNFVQNLCYYMSVEVIEPNFHMFIEKAQSNVHNIDEMIAEHNKMVENILNSCMMNDKYAFRHVSKMLQLCVSFYNLVKVI